MPVSAASMIAAPPLSADVPLAAFPEGAGEARYQIVEHVELGIQRKSGIISLRQRNEVPLRLAA